MQLTVAVIVALITAIMGIITKKLGVEGKNIPLQNLLIGLVAGILCYFLQIDGMDILTSVITCLISSMGAGGIYDLAKTNKDG